MPAEESAALTEITSLFQALQSLGYRTGMSIKPLSAGDGHCRQTKLF